MSGMTIIDYINSATKTTKQSFSIGQSVLGRDIIAMVKGSNPSVKVLIHGAIHAREFITSRLICQLAEEYKGEAEIWFVPLVNPDGVSLILNGLSTIPKWRHDFLMRCNGNNEDFRIWKANINGVDLNDNFDAMWGTGEFNVRQPNYDNYIGPYPFSEPETRALRKITRENDFLLTISYHTKGREIYWGFDDNYDYYEEAMEFSKQTGYPLLKSANSAGGYKDWFTKNYGRLGLTIEVGNDELPHPLNDDAYDEIYNENKGIAELASKVAIEMFNKIVK